MYPGGQLQDSNPLFVIKQVPPFKHILTGHCELSASQYECKRIISVINTYTNILPIILLSYSSSASLEIGIFHKGKLYQMIRGEAILFN